MGFCPKTKEYLLHDNPGADAKAHLEVCEHCRTELAKWQEVRSAIKEWDPAPGHYVTENEQTISLVNDLHSLPVFPDPWPRYSVVGQRYAFLRTAHLPQL